MALTLLKSISLLVLLGFTSLTDISTDSNAMEAAPAPCVEIAVVISDGPGGTCRALGTVTVNGVCNGVLKCGFRDEDTYRIPCCSDFGRTTPGWCKEEADTPGEN